MLGRGEHDYVLGMRNIFLLRSANRNAKQNLERGSAGTLTLECEKNILYRNAGARERKGKIKECGHTGCKALQERAPISANNCIAGLVLQSVMSATDMLGQQDVLCLSAKDPHPRQ